MAGRAQEAGEIPSPWEGGLFFFFEMKGLTYLLQNPVNQQVPNRFREKKHTPKKTHPTVQTVVTFSA